MFEDRKHKAKGKYEKVILDRFIKSGQLKGTYDFEVWISNKTPPAPVNYEERLKQANERLLEKRIDATCSAGFSLFCIEVKKKLDAEAVGQVLVNSFQLKKKRGLEIDVYPAIVCEETDDYYLEYCKEKNITVFRA